MGRRDELRPAPPAGAIRLQPPRRHADLGARRPDMAGRDGSDRRKQRLPGRSIRRPAGDSAVGHERLCGLAGGRGIPRTGSRRPSRTAVHASRTARTRSGPRLREANFGTRRRTALPLRFRGKPDRLVPPATARRRARHAHPSRIRRENQSRRNAFPHPRRQRDQRHGAGRLLHRQGRRPRDMGTRLHVPRIPVCGPLRRIGRTARSAVGRDPHGRRRPHRPAGDRLVRLFRSPARPAPPGRRTHPAGRHARASDGLSGARTLRLARRRTCHRPTPADPLRRRIVPAQIRPRHRNRRPPLHRRTARRSRLRHNRPRTQTSGRAPHDRPRQTSLQRSIARLGQRAGIHPVGDLHPNGRHAHPAGVSGTDAHMGRLPRLDRRSPNRTAGYGIG